MTKSKKRDAKGLEKSMIGQLIFQYFSFLKMDLLNLNMIYAYVCPNVAPKGRKWNLYRSFSRLGTVWYGGYLEN